MTPDQTGFRVENFDTRVPDQVMGLALGSWFSGLKMVHSDKKIRVLDNFSGPDTAFEILTSGPGYGFQF